MKVDIDLESLEVIEATRDLKASMMEGGIVELNSRGKVMIEVREYTFKRRTAELPNDLEREKTFRAYCYMGALQQASDYWFGGVTVVDWVPNNSIVTLLSNSASVNVIGTLVDCG